jgi:signal transduction histidine kinase
VLRKSREGEHLNWLVNLEENFRVDMDAHDLLELAGIILENATHWAATQIQVSCSAREGQVELVVEDDGAGASDEKIARLGVRGVRLDEASSGEGLGLSIAFEIVAVNRGRIVVDRGRLGGLRAAVTLPLAEA